MSMLLVVLLVCVYFVPTILGLRTPHAPMIFMLNLLFGWTVVGWIVSLSLALWRDKRESVCLAASSPAESYSRVAVKAVNVGQKVHPS